MAHWATTWDDHEEYHNSTPCSMLRETSVHLQNIEIRRTKIQTLTTFPCNSVFLSPVRRSGSKACFFFLASSLLSSSWLQVSSGLPSLTSVATQQMTCRGCEKRYMTARTLPGSSCCWSCSGIPLSCPPSSSGLFTVLWVFDIFKNYCNFVTFMFFPRKHLNILTCSLIYFLILHSKMGSIKTKWQELSNWKINRTVCTKTSQTKPEPFYSRRPDVGIDIELYYDYVP